MTDKSDDIQAVENLGEARDAIITELRKTIVGMDDVIDEMMIAIFLARPQPFGGCSRLGEDPFSELFGGDDVAWFQAYQFTPDLMPY